jgi:hypothetical protein
MTAINQRARPDDWIAAYRNNQGPLQIRFAVVGVFREKAKQYQNRIFGANLRLVNLAKRYNRPTFRIADPRLADGRRIATHSRHAAGFHQRCRAKVDRSHMSEFANGSEQ